MEKVLIYRKLDWGALTGVCGVVVERYQYDVYGNVTMFDGEEAFLENSALGNRFLFTGREYLPELDLYDYRNRIYSADLGRFLQTDPIRFDAGDVNIYRYVFNNPLRWVDPMGLNAIEVPFNLDSFGIFSGRIVIEDVSGDGNVEYFVVGTDSAGLDVSYEGFGFLWQVSVEVTHFSSSGSSFSMTISQQGNYNIGIFNFSESYTASVSGNVSSGNASATYYGSSGIQEYMYSGGIWNLFDDPE